MARKPRDKRVGNTVLLKAWTDSYGLRCVSVVSCGGVLAPEKQIDETIEWLQRARDWMKEGEG